MGLAQNLDALRQCRIRKYEEMNLIPNINHEYITLRVYCANLFVSNHPCYKLKSCNCSTHSSSLRGLTVPSSAYSASLSNYALAASNEKYLFGPLMKPLLFFNI